MKFNVGDLLVTDNKNVLLVVELDRHNDKKLLIGLSKGGDIYAFGYEEQTSLMVQKGLWCHYPVK
jgi:hypothetical protein